MSKQATLRYLRISPRKVRALANAIRGQSVSKVLDYFAFSKRRASQPLAKLVKSAVVNASQNRNIDVDKLYIKELRVDGGPTMKRWMPRARGMATPILKRTSHVTVVVDER